MSRWLAEGRILGKSLRRFHAIVVAGVDLDATADVARGIADAQSSERKVILGDLMGNSARFGPAMEDDDPHGLVDAFDYGISLGRVARSIAGNANLHFIPTGNTSPDYAELLAHPRWSRLMTAFTDEDHLLVLAAPLGAQSVDDLVNQLDGIVLVDGLTPGRVDEAKVIANVVLAPQPLPRLSQVVSAPVPAPEAPKVTGRTKPQSRRPVNPTIRPSVAAPNPPVRRQTTVMQAFAKPAGYGAGLSILAAFIIFWLMNQPFGDSEPRSAVPGPLQSAPGAQVQRPAPSAPDPNQLNPADSGAAVYAVRMMSANTRAGAIIRLNDYWTSMPAATYAAVDKSGRVWYEVLTGASITRGGADSLLTSLRAAGRLDSVSPGVVVRVPYAVLIDSVRPAATIPDMLKNLRQGRNWPVYALAQKNGWVWIVAGAFETRALADAYFEEMRATGQPLGVVLRQGRPY
jgi:hypothetical protein